jgi:predicted ferric reductase
MTEEALWALGRGTGITALVFLSISLTLGIATRSGRRVGVLPRFAVNDVHRFVALAGTLLVVLHLVLLFLDPYAQLRLIDLLVPCLGAYRPFWLGLGTLAFDVMMILIVTSLLRRRVGPQPFRLVHWTTYALWPIAMAHALGNGTDAGHVWFLAVATYCGVMVTTATAWRLRADFAEFSEARTPVRR